MKYTLVVGLIVIALKLNAQLSNPFDMIYYPIKYDSIISFINDSAKYKNSKLEDSYLQSMGTLYSFLGNYQKAEYLFEIRNKKKGYIPVNKRPIDLTEFGITQDTLNELYGSFNVILFNESHYKSKHRAFLYSQLEILKDLGYNQLALEALNEKDIELKSRNYPLNNYPTLLTGVYTNDPVYGNLIRKALTLGFSLIPYDSDRVRRDKGQADNIYKQYDREKGKLIVYGGLGHISEEFPMMGYHLKKRLNEDVLSISQFTQYSVKPIFPKDLEFELFLQQDSSNCFDYYIYSNPVQTNSNIPFWYKWMDFKTIPLKDLYSKSIDKVSLIQLFYTNEENGIPIYQFLSDNNDDIDIAYPKSGTYILRITNVDELIDEKVDL